MKIRDIMEAPESADDLFRKIDSLQAMINDKAASDGEKQNAQVLKARLEKKLKANFPDAIRPPPKGADSSMGWDDDWLARMAKAAAQEKHFKENPEEGKRFYRDKLDKLLALQKNARRRAAMGDVEAKQDLKDLKPSIERIYKEWFPEEYQEIMKKKAADAERSSKRAYDDSVARHNSASEKTKNDMGLDAVGEEYKNVLKVLHDKLEGVAVKYPGTSSKFKLPAFKSGRNTLYELIYVPASELRKAFTELPEDVQAKIKEAVGKVHDKGYNLGHNEGYTPAQKARVLDTLRPSKAPPRRDWKAEEEAYKKQQEEAGIIDFWDWKNNPETQTIFAKLKPVLDPERAKQFKSWAKDAEPNEVSKSLIQYVINSLTDVTGVKALREKRKQVADILSPEERTDLLDKVKRLTLDRYYFNKGQKTRLESILGDN